MYYMSAKGVNENMINVATFLFIFSEKEVLTGPHIRAGSTLVSL